MKKLFAFALVLLLFVAAVWAGWVTFARSPERATITIDAQEAKQDTREVLDAGKELLDSALDKAKDKTTDPAPETRDDQ